MFAPLSLSLLSSLSHSNDVPSTLFPRPRVFFPSNQVPRILGYDITPSHFLVVVKGVPLPCHAEQVRSNTGLGTDVHAAGYPAILTPPHTQVAIPPEDEPNTHVSGSYIPFDHCIYLKQCFCFLLQQLHTCTSELPTCVLVIAPPTRTPTPSYSG